MNAWSHASAAARLAASGLVYSAATAAPRERRSMVGGPAPEAAEAAMRREVCARERRVPPLESEREAKRRGALGVVASCERNR